MAGYIRPTEKIVLRQSDPQAVARLSEALNVSPMLAQILVGRGLVSFDDSKAYFNPSLETLHDPFLFNGMDAAITHTVEAIKAGQKICVYGDYDVDGVTSTSFLMRVFNKLQVSCCYYLPDRLTEGYGLSPRGFDAIKAMGASLVISVDCGITAIEEATYAKGLGLGLIITDHHEPKEVLPEAIAIINPKKHGDTYPDKNLAGVGVALKFAQALCERLEVNRAVWADELDLVALGTAADIVPFVGENRVIATYGYKRMQETDNLGLHTLMDLQNIENKIINTSDVVFKLAPAVNAAGRLGDPSKGLKLFLSQDAGECDLFARELMKVNNERRTYNEKVEKEAKLWADTQVDFDKEFAVICGDRSWHAGVIGIAASKVVEAYCRPAFLFSVDKEGKAHGSGRSIDGCDLVTALDSCKDLLERYGGHKMAAGATLPEENIPAFRIRFNEALKSQLEQEKLVPVVHVDVEARIPQLTPKFFGVLKRMEPFGPKNMRPVLYSKGLTLRQPPQNVGKGGAHLKLSVRADGVLMDAIGFGFGERAAELRTARSFSLAYTLTENTFRGQTTLQMNIKGIEIEA